MNELMIKELEKRLYYAKISYRGEPVAVDEITPPKGGNTFFYIDGRTSDQEGGWCEFDLIWNECTESFASEEGNVEVILPTYADALKMEETLDLVNKQVEDAKAIFESLGFKQDMELLCQDSALMVWNSSRCW